MPSLPFGLSYIVIGSAILVFVLWLVKKFADEFAQNAAQSLWAALSRKQRSYPRRHEILAYREKVAVTYNAHALGFLQNSPVTVSDIYVPLQYEDNGQRHDVYDSIRSQGRTVILGAAGAGKSMLLKNSMVKWSSRPEDYGRIPVFIELFRTNSEHDPSLYDLILEAFRRNDIRRPEKFVEGALEGGFLSVFWDGLDEVLTDRRDVIVDRVERFAEEYPECQFIVTCREAVYENDLRPIFSHEIRILGFDDAALYRFLRLWLSQRHEKQNIRYEVEQLVAALRASPALLMLARSPLLITMIATLYDADPGIGPVLTNSRTEFYDMAVGHLLRRDRDLGRHGAIAAYKAGHKSMVLRAVALKTQGAMVPGSDRRTINESDLLSLTTEILSQFNLDAEHAPRLLDEVVARSGLLVKVDEGNLLYEFPHLTLQEYLAAIELADDPKRLLDLYKSNPVRWRETLKMWCGGANRDCTSVVEEVFGLNSSAKILALECLAEARRIDDRAAQAILAYFERRLGDLGTRRPLVLAALGTVAADPGPRGKQLMARLQKAAFSTDVGVRNDAVHALAKTRLRAAIETVSEVAAESTFARSALISMGDQAVPVLEERAEGGSTDAVDDLRAIATPSAAIALSGLVWREDEIAIRAAWRLAALIESVDIEEELQHVELSNTTDSMRYDWLWEPFVDTHKDTRVAIIGRIAYLIDSCGPGSIPDATDSIDPRIALPLSVRAISKSSRNDNEDALIETEATDRAVIRNAFEIFQGREKDPDSPLEIRSHEHAKLIRAKLLQNPAAALRMIANEDPARAHRLSRDVIASRHVPAACGAFMTNLPASVQVEIAALTLEGRLDRVSETDWRRVREPAENPRVLRVFATTVPAIAATGLILSGASLVKNDISEAGGWAWKLLLVTTVVVLFTGILLTVIGLALASHSHVESWLRKRMKMEEPDAKFGTAGVILGVCGCTSLFLLGILQLYRVFGTYQTAVGTVVVAAIAVILNLLLRARNATINNPYRTLLRIDERVTIARATVIAPKPRKSSENATSAITD